MWGIAPKGRSTMKYEEEMAILDRALEIGDRSVIKLDDWNTAVSLQAALKRFIKYDTKSCAEIYPPGDPRGDGRYSKLKIKVMKPGNLVIERGKAPYEPEPG